MASVLHLLRDPDAKLSRAVIDQHVRAGDRVSVVLLPGSTVADLPATVRVRRLETDLSYPELLDLIFESDQVITW
jgi:hypothetical protein